MIVPWTPPLLGTSCCTARSCRHQEKYWWGAGRIIFPALLYHKKNSQQLVEKPQQRAVGFGHRQGEEVLRAEPANLLALLG
jgi:hypothetical protein